MMGLARQVTQSEAASHTLPGAEEAGRVFRSRGRATSQCAITMQRTDTIGWHRSWIKGNRCTNLIEEFFSLSFGTIYDSWRLKRYKKLICFKSNE